MNLRLAIGGEGGALGFYPRTESVTLSVLFVDENRDGLLPDELVLNDFEDRSLRMGIEVYWHGEFPLNAWSPT